MGAARRVQQDGCSMVYIISFVCLFSLLADVLSKLSLLEVWATSCACTCYVQGGDGVDCLSLSRKLRVYFAVGSADIISEEFVHDIAGGFFLRSASSLLVDSKFECEDAMFAN